MRKRFCDFVKQQKQSHKRVQSQKYKYQTDAENFLLVHSFIRDFKFLTRAKSADCIVSVGIVILFTIYCGKNLRAWGTTSSTSPILSMMGSLLLKKALNGVRIEDIIHYFYDAHTKYIFEWTKTIIFVNVKYIFNLYSCKLCNLFCMFIFWNYFPKKA